jgi:hypothetical protein
LVHGIGGFSPWLVGSAVLGPVVRQNIMVETLGSAKLLTSPQEVKGERGVRIPVSPSRPPMT